MGAPAHLPDLRARGLLRLVAQPARDQALPRLEAPHRHLGRAGRDLVVVLRRRGGGGLVSDGDRSPDAIAPAPREGMFPTLTEAQIARIRPYGRERTVAAGEVLFEHGTDEYKFGVVLE